MEDTVKLYKHTVFGEEDHVVEEYTVWQTVHNKWWTQYFKTKEDRDFGDNCLVDSSDLDKFVLETCCFWTLNPDPNYIKPIDDYCDENIKKYTELYTNFRNTAKGFKVIVK